MSCEAKVWWEKDGWHGIHDGKCSIGDHHDEQYGEYGLSTLLQQLEKCYYGEDSTRTMQWYFRTYPGDTQIQVGLVGYAS